MVPVELSILAAADVTTVDMPAYQILHWKVSVRHVAQLPVAQVAAKCIMESGSVHHQIVAIRAMIAVAMLAAPLFLAHFPAGQGGEAAS